MIRNWIIVVIFWAGTIHGQKVLKISDSLQGLALQQFNQDSLQNLNVNLDLVNNEWRLTQSDKDVQHTYRPHRGLLTQQQEARALINKGEFVEAKKIFPPAFEAKVGADDRALVKTPTQFPHNTVGKIFMDCPCRSSRSQCSGTLIGSRMVLTAAHCIYDIALCQTRRGCCQASCTNFVFVPAYPFNTTSYTAVKANTPAGFIAGFLTGQPLQQYGQFDIAVLQLEETAPKAPPVLSYGFIGCVSGTLQLYISGYPEDIDDGENMYYSACRQKIDTCSEDSVFYHSCDTERGMSGSSIWAIDDNGIVIIGVHSRATFQNTTAVNLGILMNRASTVYLQTIQQQINLSSSN